MPVARKTYIILAVLLLITVVGLLIIAIRYNQVFTTTTERMHHTITVLDADQQALGELHDYEAGNADSRALRQRILQLRQLTVDDPTQEARAHDLEELTATLPGRHDAGMGKPDTGTDRIRVLLLKLQMEEIGLLKSREAAGAQSRRSLKAAIIALPGAIFALLFSLGYVNLHNYRRRINAEKWRKESERLLSLLIGHVKDYAIMMLDTEGRVRSWNEGAQQMKGYTSEEVIGRPISLFYTDEDNERGESAANLQNALQLGRHESVGSRKRKDGSVFYADVVFTALRNERGELTGFIKITRDITAQVTAREEINNALAKEKALNELKSRFVALASHEFKTPLSVIMSSASLVEKYDAPEMSEKRHRHVHRIKSNVNNLKQLLNDFLSLEKLEGGMVRNAPVESDVVQIADEAMQDMVETCKEGQRMEFGVHGIPRPVAIDQHLLRNILNNLLSNAVKYSPQMSLVRFVLEFELNTVSFKVTDSGIGIPAEEQDQLFERFFRASNTSGIPGTGLGLSIVKRYLDLMGGTIQMESRPGTGTTFIVVFPAETGLQEIIEPSAHSDNDHAG